MGQLYPNIYDNPSRVVTGVVTIFPDDVQILCDTTSGAITINLLSIPAFKWNVNYKLYIADYTNTASTNNITINAAAGQTINGGASIVINNNSGACLIQVGSNTTYIATFYPLPVAAPLAISDILGPVTTNTTKITFTNATVTPTSATEVDVTAPGGVSAITALAPLTGGTITTSGNIGINAANGTTDGYLAQADWTTFNNKVGSVGVTAPVTNSGTSTAPVIGMPAANKTGTDGYLTSVAYGTFDNKVSTVNASFPLKTTGTGTNPTIEMEDTGWQNCDGFEHMASSVFRPQFRIYGKQVFLRGIAIIPLATPSNTYIAPTFTGASSYYVNELDINCFTATSGLVNGVNAGDDEVSFNLGASIIPNTFAAGKVFPRTVSQWVVGVRPIITSTPTVYNYLTGMFRIAFGNALADAPLKIESVYRYESGFGDGVPPIVTSGFGSSNIRRMAGRIKSGQFLATYLSMTNTSYNSSSFVNTSFSQNYSPFIDPTFVTPSFLHDIDTGSLTSCGGFQFYLDDITLLLD